jgi:hypothetical protein
MDLIIVSLLDKTEEQVRRQFYWRGMTEDIGNFI